MRRLIMSVVLLSAVFLCIPVTHAMLYEFNGTFVGSTVPETSIFDPLENQPFSGEFDLANKYFSFQTTGYSYVDSQVSNWLYFNPDQSLILMSDGIYFDVRDVAGSPTTLWIKSGIDMIGGELIASPVPIPGAAWLFGSALVGFAGFRKRFKKA